MEKMDIGLRLKEPSAVMGLKAGGGIILELWSGSS
jgi:hypothetical protein